ncbi:MAG: hypothetical protein IPK31_12890 [Chitinophagaceae bacterium]|nr:hypothetical protein [Chitinophagaceae bacterium]
MKRFLLSAIILLIAFTGIRAQSFMNEWIDFNKTYYKFNIGSTGVYRISQAQLASMGIQSADAAHFQLWRHGKQIPVYTSVSAGTIPANGFIEFWGEANDGKWEKRMFIEPQYQINDKWSLYTDTAAYFLTVNTSAGANLRLVQTNNDLSSALPAESYFMHKTALYYRATINPGFGAVVGSTVYSSSFDEGESWTSSAFRPANPLVSTQSNLYVAMSGPNASLKFSAAGRALNTRTVRATINGTAVADIQMNYFNAIIDESATNIPLSVISSNTANVEFRTTSAEVTDAIVIGMYELTYPRQFNFNGQANFEFEVAASATGNNLIIDNANFGSQPPVLYDLTNGLRITAAVLSPTQVRVVLPPSAITRKLVLISQEPANIKSVAGPFTARTFSNYGLTANQANYIIISNPLLYNDGTGANQVEQYRLYRNTSTGGGFNAKIFNAQDIIDQFGYGVKNNAYAIKNFLRFAYSSFSVKPENCLLIGKGVIYTNYRSAESSSTIDQLNLVPVYGSPASDMQMASEDGNIVPRIPIGRLNVINGKEVKDYLEKVKQYESYYNSNSCKIEDEIWKKNVIHVGGANDFLGEQIMFYLSQFSNIVKDTLFGGDVYSIQKTGVATVQTVASENISRLFREGFSLLTYFGHSSPTTLEYNLDNPSAYPVTGKYPVFMVNGCQAGNLFLSDATRLTGNMIISERWVLTPQLGSIAFIASTHLGIVNYLNLYTDEFYNQVAHDSYGQSIGHIMANVNDTLIRLNSFNDFYVRMHLEEIALHGDPAIKFYSFQKPDYAIESSMVKVAPEFISIAEDKFKVNVKIANIGRTVSDSVHVVITREIPDGTKTIVYDQKIRGVRNTDSIELILTINPFTDKGSNKINVSIDPENNSDEICETNNIITKEFFIFEDEIRPVYPYNYSIINKQNITYYASTANPLGTIRKYYFEIDTTQSFNSSLKKIDSVSSIGGSISIKPSGVNFTDSAVYYWRVGMRPAETSAVLWNNFSFVYIAGTETGFNQSHYYQHQQSSYRQLFLEPDNRVYKFDSTIARLQVRTGIYPYHTSPSLDVSLNYNFLERYGCRYGSFQFYVFDGKTLQNWKNWLLPSGEGRYRSASPACNSPTDQRLFFEYYYHDPAYRKRAMDFMDSVKDGDYVVVTNLGWVPGPFVDASVLKSDEVTLGAGNSIYHKFKNAGFGLVDSFKNTLPMIFIYKKNDPSFTPVQHIGITNEQITEVVEIPSYYTSGNIESPWFGPSKSWKELIWKGTDREPLMPDTTSIDIIGKTSSGIELLLATVKQLRDTSLAFINPLSFPYIKLRMNNMDNMNVTPHQLKSWMILADYVPEGAVAPNLTFRFQDTVEVGQPLDFAIAFKNVSETAFDSLKLKLIITDRNNVPKQIILPKKRPLLAGDSIVVSYQIDTKDLAGLNTLYLMVNPDNDQQEQFLFNNFVFKGFYVKPDNYKPWLDVTFDGTHILNRDIVSSKPHILVKLKDESRFMALSDTAGMKIQIRYPGTNGAIVDYKPNSDSVRFTPANLTNNSENAATIDLFPTLNEDGEYELTVSGTDRSGNKAGDLEYKVAFQVINKPMISNLLNYPNPFTTSTAFVFTITGSEVPQNIRIQILTITGKVVREITKAELGALRVGRNITDFKWDGTDQYGNKLANGIYLYRVITNHNGKALDKYKATDDNTDQYFNKGYGKMYLMR